MEKENNNAIATRLPLECTRSVTFINAKCDIQGWYAVVHIRWMLRRCLRAVNREDSNGAPRSVVMVDGIP